MLVDLLGYQFADMERAFTFERMCQHAGLVATADLDAMVVVELRRWRDKDTLDRFATALFGRWTSTVYRVEAA